MHATTAPGIPFANGRDISERDIDTDNSKRLTAHTYCDCNCIRHFIPPPMARPRTRTLTLIAGDHGRDLPLRHRWTAPYAPARRRARQLLCAWPERAAPPSEPRIPSPQGFRRARSGWSFMTILDPAAAILRKLRLRMSAASMTRRARPRRWRRAIVRLGEGALSVRFGVACWPGRWR